MLGYSLSFGSGMDLETVLGYWMEPGATSKMELKGQRTGKGRRVLGEKGIGRFAADKLARRLELISRRAGDKNEVLATFDWDEFDSESSMLSEIRNRWEARPAEAIPGQGTILTMTGLRSRWNERIFRRLCTRLSRLRSPFGELDSFAIRIESDEFPRYSGELRADFLDRAPYRIEATFDGEQAIEVRVNDARPDRHAWNGDGYLFCGPVRIRIHAFDLETDAVARVGPRMDVRPWIKEWSGISIYRDGFRVWPYGEPHDDWLRLDQRRVNNPVVRLSNNQVVGFVQISGDRNPGLKDQTSREGLLNNRAYEDLRRLLYFVLQILESERQSVRHPTVHSVGGISPRVNAVPAVPAMLEKLAQRSTPEMATELRRISVRLQESLAREQAMHRRLVEVYSELAAAAQAASVLSLSLRPVIPRMRKYCDDLRERLDGAGGREVAKHLQMLEASVAAVDERISILVAGELRIRLLQSRFLRLGSESQ